jgi:DNA-binding transcriptional ArsR family regulator
MKLATTLDNGTPHAQQLDEMASHAYHATELLKALASESRLMILCTLVDGEKSVGELNELMDRRQSSVSQQLGRLRRQGLVTARREGKTVYYSIASEEAQRIISVLHDLYCNG